MKNIKRILALALAMALIACSCLSLVSCGGAKYTVGVCQLVQHPALDAATQGFVDTLKAEFGDDIEIIVSNASGEESVCTTIATDFVNKNVDLILANATSALTATVSATQTIPVLGTSITDYGEALGIEDLASKGNVIGANVSGTSDMVPYEQQVACMKELFPEAKKAALLYCSAEPNSAVQVKAIKELLEKEGITCIDKSFSDGNDAMVVAAAAAAEADFIYIPTDNTAADNAEAIGGKIGNTPVFAAESGICSGCGVATLSIDYYQLGVATGEMAIEILKGEKKAGEMPVKVSTSFTKQYNKAKCNEIGFDTARLEELGYVAIGD